MLHSERCPCPCHQKRKGDFSRESSPSLPIFRRSGSASRPQPVNPGVLRDLRARTRVSPILPESHLLRERPRFCPSAPSLPDASVSPVAGPRDINVSSLSLWKISAGSRWATRSVWRQRPATCGRTSNARFRQCPTGFSLGLLLRNHPVLPAPRRLSPGRQARRYLAETSSRTRPANADHNSTSSCR